MADELKSILSILENSQGYDVALLTTFNFEIDFFEKAVLNRLIKNDVRKVSVYIDSRELAKAVSRAVSGNIGVRYVVNPVEMQGAFHPKIILLLGEKKARLIIGSGNLKTSGYYINNEVYGCLDYSPGRPEFRRIIYDAIRFFEECNRFTPGLDTELLNEVRRRPYYRPAPECERAHLLGNGTLSILQQVRRLITDKVEEIKIAVPYYDNGLVGLRAIRETWPDAGIRLYLQHKWCTYQKPDNDDAKELVFESIDSEENDNNHFYHGKVFLLKTADSDYLLYGSSNCTQSAVTKSKEEGGNYECDILIKGNTGEYEDFFSQFIIIDKEPEGHPMIHTSDDEENFFFRYGISEDKTVLHIGFSRVFKQAVFSYHNVVLPWRKTDGEIVIEVDGDQIPCGIFDLTVEYDDRKEIINCWFVDRSALEFFRIPDKNSEELLTDSDDFGEGDKFREDYEKLLRAMGSCSQDWAQMRQSIAPYLAAKEEEEGADRAGQDDSEEDFIVNVDLSDEDYSAYRQFCTMERIRNKVTEKYLHSLPLFFRLSWSTGSAAEGEKEDRGIGKAHKITQEKRFQRFVRRIVRNISDPSNMETVSRDHYIGIIAALFSVFDDEKNDGLFNADYLIKTRCELILAIISKLDPDREVSRLWISKIIGTLLYNHSISIKFENADRRNACEQSNRRVLLALEDRFHIRNCFSSFFILSGRSGDEIKQEQGIQYIEQLYGYQDIEKIEENLRKYYGNYSGLNVENGVARVDVISDKLERFLKPDSKLVRELKRYSANVQKLSAIVITIRNPYKMTGPSIVKVEHRINLTYNQWRCSILRANGLVDNSPSTFLHV